VSRSRVEPLHVIDGDHHRPAFGKPPEHRQQPECDALLVGRVGSLVTEEEGHLERSSESRRQALQGV
jgi:hypothetical protein